MAINKNHEFEDLDGIKCAIVEKNVPADRVEFLKKLLEFNRFTVVVAKSPQPKAVPKSAVPSDPNASAVTAIGAADVSPAPIHPPAPETFTLGVTDVAFNATNAIFGRLLRTPDGRVVTLAYWEQIEKDSNDEIPYFEIKK